MITLTDKIIYISYALIISILLHGVSASVWVRGKSLYAEGYFERRPQLKNTCLRVGYASLSILVLLITILFCAFRRIGAYGEGVGGTDSYIYMMMFQNCTGTLSQCFEKNSGLEPLYTASMWLVRSVTDNYRALLVVYYLILGRCFLKYSQMFPLNRRAFFSTFCLVINSLDSYNTQRNTLAEFLSLYILDALLKRQYKRAFLFLFLMTGIHYSAAIYLVPILCLYLIKLPSKDYLYKFNLYVIASLVGSALVSLFVPHIISGTRLSVYKSQPSVSVAMLAYYASVAFFVILHNRLVSQITGMRVFTSVYLAFAPVFVFQLYYSITYRLMLYTIPVLYVLIWLFKDALHKKKDVVSMFWYALFNIILVLRVFSPMLSDFSHNGSYESVLLP